MSSGPAAAGSTLARRLAPFRHRDFRLLTASFLIDAVGSWASGVVVAIWIFQQTHSLALLALQPAASWIPGLLLAPIAGVVADRYDRRTILILCATLLGILYTAEAVVVGVNGPYPIVLVCSVLGASIGSPYRPAAGALTPEVVDEATLPAANGVFATMEELVVVVGPAIGGVLLLLGEPWIGVAINATSFFVAAVLAGALRVRSRGEAEAGDSVPKQFIAGVRALTAAPTAGLLFVFAALDSVVANLYTVAYIPISTHVGLGTDGYGFLLAGCAVGGVIGALFAERLAAGKRLAPVIVGGLLVQALPYAFTAVTTSAPVAIGLQLVSGAGMIVVDVLALTAVQREVPGGALSRVLSLFDMCVLVACIVGGFAGAALLAAVPYGPALVIIGVGISAVALVLSPLLVRADRKAAATAATIADRAALFAQADLLRDLSRQSLERLAAAATVRELSPGEVLLHEGDPADAVYVVTAGDLHVASRSSDARGLALPDVTAPDVVGEIGVLRSLPRTASLTAAGPATVWRVDGQLYLDALTPERIPLLFAGLPSTRLARTHPQLAATE